MTARGADGGDGRVLARVARAFVRRERSASIYGERDDARQRVDGAQVDEGLAKGCIYRQNMVCACSQECAADGSAPLLRVKQNDHSCLYLLSQIVEGVQRRGLFEDISNGLDRGVAIRRIKDNEAKLLFCGCVSQGWEIKPRMVGEVERCGFAGVGGQDDGADIAPKHRSALFVVYEERWSGSKREALPAAGGCGAEGEVEA